MDRKLGSSMLHAPNLMWSYDASKDRYSSKIKKAGDAAIVAVCFGARNNTRVARQRYSGHEGYALRKVIRDLYVGCSETGVVILVYR